MEKNAKNSDQRVESIRVHVFNQLERLKKAWIGQFRFPEPLETQFQVFYYHETVFYTLTAIGLAILLLVSASVIDITAGYENPFEAHVVRLSLCIVLMIAWLLIKHSQRAAFSTLVVVSTISVGALCINLIATYYNGSFKFIYYSTNTLLYIIGFSMIRIQIQLALLCGIAYWLLLIAFLVHDPVLDEQTVIALGFFNFSGCVVSLVCCYLLERYVRTQFLQSQLLGIQKVDLHRANDHLKSLVALDALTQIYSRRGFDNKIQQEWSRCRRSESMLSLILLDVDYFKQYNDTYGHDQGDKCLQAITSAINTLMKRPSDIFARYGGEEFAILLPQTDARAAMEVAEKVRLCVETLALPHEGSAISDTVTISLGVSAIVPGANHTITSLLRQADKALYRSKALGRNTVTAFEQDHYLEQ